MSFILILSCDDPAKSLQGEWMVEVVTINQDTLAKGAFPENRIFFKSDGGCLIPNHFFLKDHQRVWGKWEIQESEGVQWLIIRDALSILNGKYQFETQLTEVGKNLYLKSDSVQINAWSWSITEVLNL